jgi:O-antigen/teichoic acid export membrane protein
MVCERRKIIKFSLPLLFARMFNQILGRIDILMIGLFLPANMVGIYGVAKRFIPLIIVPLGAFNTIFAPIIAELFCLEKLDLLKDQFKTVARWVFMISLPTFTLLTFFSREILAVFGPDFVAGSSAMLMLCLGQLINAATGAAGFMLMMTGRPHVNLMNSGLLCITNIVLNLYLIPKYGIMGAAFASAVSITAIQLLRLAEIWYFLRIHPYRWDFWKPTVSCLISVLIISASARLGINPNHIMNMAMLALLFISTYMVLLYLFKPSPEDRIVLQALKHRLAPEKY